VSPLPPASAPVPKLCGLRILLVEDDLEVREATESLLQEEGAAVVSVDAAEPALALLGGTMPLDLVISDVVLGGPLSGIDVAEAARRRRPAVPVLLATGYAAPAETLGRRLPTDVPLLLKPFRRATLLAAATATLNAKPRRVHA
jgi:CheY-like chemotaxis protein